jgi:hypothetical protein
MAKAPKVKPGGYQAADERKERARLAIRFTVKDSDITFVWRPFGIPTRIRSHVRNTTGMPIDTLLFDGGAVDVASYVDMWWISRMCADEAGADGRLISRAAVQAEFDERCPGAAIGDFVQSDASDEVDDSPEA